MHKKKTLKSVRNHFGYLISLGSLYRMLPVLQMKHKEIKFAHAAYSKTDGSIFVTMQAP